MYLKKEELEILKEVLDFLLVLGEDNEVCKKYEDVVSSLEERYNKRNNYSTSYMNTKRQTDKNYRRPKKEEYVIDFENLGI